MNQNPYMTKQIEKQPTGYVQYAPMPQVSPWGVVGSAIGSGLGWLFKNVAPAVVAGAAGGYIVHKIHEANSQVDEDDAEDLEDETSDEE